MRRDGDSLDHRQRRAGSNTADKFRMSDMTATLVRDAMEESHVLVTAAVYLGYQEVRRDADPPFAELRMAGLIGYTGAR
jgi:hypothetical protein